MPQKTSSKATKPSNNTGPQTLEKPQGKKTRSPATMAARRQASARYRQKNLEEERDKARERMAKHRERINQQEDLAAVSRARAREASRAFRQRNATTLAHRQRIIRMEAYGKKHGHRAWLQRQQLLEERRAEAQELADYHRHQEFLTKLLQEPLPSIILLHVGGQICSCGYNDSCLVNLKGHSVTSHKRTNAQTGKMHFGKM
ncbi:hypothetical protein B0H13DRAFT_1913885 [Mycena leptocephala]|nr:hypothetical protein B0H13DRAFT_1913885 [Mycena leptocephala]